MNKCYVCLKDRGSYMSAHLLLNLVNQLRKRDLLSLFRNGFNKRYNFVIMYARLLCTSMFTKNL